MKALYVIILSFLLSNAAIAQFVQLDISQQVNRQQRRTSYSKAETVSKNVTISVKSSKDIEILVCLFYSSGGRITKEFFSDAVYVNKPFTKTFMPSPASSEEIRIAATDYGWTTSTYKIGNSKIMTCFIVYDKKTGKKFGMKSTSPQIEKTVMIKFKDEIEKFINANIG